LRGPRAGGYPPAAMHHPPPRADGKLETIVTHLEMHERPTRTPAPPPRADLTIVRAVHPTVSFYRYLYDTVGEPWIWTDRRRIDDAALAAIVHDPKVEVHVLYAAGTPAGYTELDLRKWPDIELGYFGLVPEFIGQKLGPYLLDWSVDEAWSRGPARFWVHTCTLDHPGALAMYERAGFRRFHTEVEVIADPRVQRLA
jgi:GNAT superfamily N-acetyltransferase